MFLLIYSKEASLLDSASMLLHYLWASSLLLVTSEDEHSDCERVSGRCNDYVVCHMDAQDCYNGNAIKNTIVYIITLLGMQ